MSASLLPLWLLTALLLSSLWGLGLLAFPEGKASHVLCSGWALLLLLCSLAWFLGLSGHQLRPVFWLFALTGLLNSLRLRQWRPLLVLWLGSALLAALLWGPFLANRNLLAYSSFGTDLWGYLNTAEWLQSHAVSHLPVPGSDSMRFNWTWYVLSIQERPLSYTCLACLSSAGGIPPWQGYLLLPVALLSSLAACLPLQGRLLSGKGFWLALPLGLLLCLQPLPLLHWVAQLFSNHLVSCLLSLAFLCLLTREDQPGSLRRHAWACLLIILCAGLYARQFILVAALVAAAPALTAWLLQPRPPRQGLPLALFGLSALLAAAIFTHTREIGSELIEAGRTGDIGGQLLSPFGGVSPFGWLGYLGMKRWDYQPGPNPLGLLCAALFLTLLALLAWSRWKQDRDLALPFLCLGAFIALLRVSNDHNLLARTLPLFIPGLLFCLALFADELPWKSAAFLALLLPLLPPLRSASELQLHLQGEVLSWSKDSPIPSDKEALWLMLAYLHFNEDAKGYDWKNHPIQFYSITHYLPSTDRALLNQKHGLPWMDTRTTPARELPPDRKPNP